MSYYTYIIRKYSYLISVSTCIIISTTFPAHSTELSGKNSELNDASALKSFSDTMMVFSAERDGQWDIFAWVPLSDQKPIRLTSDPGDELRPSLSTDYSLVVYEDTSGRIWQVRLANKERRELMTLSARNKFIQPAVSPNGKMALFAMRHDPSKDDTDLAFFRMNEDPTVFADVVPIEVGPAWVIQETDKIQVLDMVSSQYSPCWSPEGRRLAFVNLHDRGSASGKIISEIWETRLDHSYARQLTLLRSLCEDPSWSPVMDHIAFSCNKHHQFDIFSVDLESVSVQRLTNDPACDSDPVYSPDGRHIAFVSLRSGASSLWLLGIQDKNIIKLSPFGVEDIPCKDPDWK